MIPHYYPGPPEYGWKRLTSFPVLQRLEARYRIRRVVDRSYWNTVFSTVRGSLHSAYPTMGRLSWPLGHIFQGKVCILYPTFDGGRMYGTHLERSVRVYGMGDPSPERVYAVVLAMVLAEEAMPVRAS